MRMKQWSNNIVFSDDMAYLILVFMIRYGVWGIMFVFKIRLRLLGLFWLLKI